MRVIRFRGTEFVRSATFPLPSKPIREFLSMGVAPENTCVSQETGSREAGAAAVKPAKDKAADPLSYEELLREYDQLRERSSRTTNALGSAAHDLKTPLSILNGYIELLEN